MITLYTNLQCSQFSFGNLNRSISRVSTNSPINFLTSTGVYTAIMGLLMLLITIVVNVYVLPRVSTDKGAPVEGCTEIVQRKLTAFMIGCYDTNNKFLYLSLVMITSSYDRVTGNTNSNVVYFIWLARILNFLMITITIYYLLHNININSIGLLIFAVLTMIIAVCVVNLSVSIVPFIVYCMLDDVLNVVIRDYDHIIYYALHDKATWKLMLMLLFTITISWCMLFSLKYLIHLVKILLDNLRQVWYCDILCYLLMMIIVVGFIRLSYIFSCRFYASEDTWYTCSTCKNLAPCYKTTIHKESNHIINLHTEKCKTGQTTQKMYDNKNKQNSQPKS